MGSASRPQRRQADASPAGLRAPAAARAVAHRLQSARVRHVRPAAADAGRNGESRDCSRRRSVADFCRSQSPRERAAQSCPECTARHAERRAHDDRDGQYIPRSGLYERGLATSSRGSTYRSALRTRERASRRRSWTACSIRSSPRSLPKQGPGSGWRWFTASSSSRVAMSASTASSGYGTTVKMYFPRLEESREVAASPPRGGDRALLNR